MSLSKLDANVSLVKAGVRIEFAGGTVVTLSYTSAEQLQFDIARELKKYYGK